MTTNFLEKILGLGQISGWINNSAQSYSLATGLIEEQLMDSNMTKKEPWKILTVPGTSWDNTGRTLTAYTGGSTMPMPGQGNSSFDLDWNIIGMGEPVQIVIPDNISWNNVNFSFRVPKINGNTSSTWVDLSMTNTGFILWTFWYSGASLYASGETQIFKGDEIDGNPNLIEIKDGLTNSWAGLKFNVFYSAHWAKCANYQCTLKLSMIRPFITVGGQSFPFLEYKIEFPPTDNIPNQYMVIDSTAYVYGYLRSRQVRIPQITTSTATDFAVLQ